MYNINYAKFSDDAGDGGDGPGRSRRGDGPPRHAHGEPSRAQSHAAARVHGPGHDGTPAPDDATRGAGRDDAGETDGPPRPRRFAQHDDVAAGHGRPAAADHDDGGSNEATWHGHGHGLQPGTWNVLIPDTNPCI